MRNSTLLVEAEAKRRVRRRSGRLFSSITSEVEGDGAELLGRVSTDVSYAPFVENPTRAHDIVAHGRALMIPISPGAGGGGPIFGGGKLSGGPRAGQQVAFFARVHHPGTPGFPFLKPALEDNVGTIGSIFKREMDAVLEAVARA